MTEWQKTIVFDLDGTIAFNGAPVEESIGLAIQRKKAEGFDIIFATARPARDALPLLPVYLHDETIIACNGAVTSKKGKILSHIHFDEEASHSLFNFLNGNNIPYVIDGLDNYSISEVHHEFHSYIRKLSRSPVSYEEVLAEKLTKFLILDKNYQEGIVKFITETGIRCNINYHKKDDIFDLVPDEVNKFNALQQLGIKERSYICFGNDKNDALILANARNANVVGNELISANATYLHPHEVSSRILEVM